MKKIIIYSFVFIFIITNVLWGENSLEKKFSLFYKNLKELCQNCNNNNLEIKAKINIDNWLKENKFSQIKNFTEKLSKENINTIFLTAEKYNLYSLIDLPVYIKLDEYGQKTILTLPSKNFLYIVQGNNGLISHQKNTYNEFAWDFVMYNEKERMYKGNARKNESYFCWGTDVLAPADGIIDKVENKYPDHLPGTKQISPANIVAINHLNGEISLLVHFKQNSILVKEGDKIKRGDVLGLCGDSGNSAFPHIHYQLNKGETYKESKPFSAHFSYYFKKEHLKDNAILEIGNIPKQWEIISNSKF